MEQVLGSPSTELLQRLNAKPTVHSAPTAQYNYKRVSCNCKLNIFVSKMFQQNELPLCKVHMAMASKGPQIWSC